MSPRLEYRRRFSVAHEIGHLVLHRDIYAGLQHATAAEWFDYISAIPENRIRLRGMAGLRIRRIQNHCGFQNQRAFEKGTNLLDYSSC